MDIMRNRELKVWKKQQEKQAREIAEPMKQAREPISILNFYPEFHLQSPYTTALDGYAPPLENIASTDYQDSFLKRVDTIKENCCVSL